MPMIESPLSISQEARITLNRMGPNTQPILSTALNKLIACPPPISTAIFCCKAYTVLAECPIEAAKLKINMAKIIAQSPLKNRKHNIPDPPIIPLIMM